MMSLWPLCTILPAAFPYLIYNPNEVYGPSITGQCFFVHSKLTAYLITLWDGVLLVYILIAYIVVFVYLNYISKKMKYSLLIQQSDERRKMKKFLLSLSVSPVLYWLFYIGLVVSRLVEFAIGEVPLELLRVSVTIYLLVGFFNSIWFGYSSELYVKTYRNVFNHNQRNKY